MNPRRDGGTPVFPCFKILVLVGIDGTFFLNGTTFQAKLGRNNNNNNNHQSYKKVPQFWSLEGSDLVGRVPVGGNAVSADDDGRHLLQVSSIYDRNLGTYISEA